MVSGKRFHVETSSIGRYRYAVGYRPVLDSAVLVGSVVSVPTLFRQDRLEEETTIWNAFLFGVYTLVFLAVLGIAAVLSNRIARPIQRLTEATRRVAAGDLTARVEPTSRDELSALVLAFNQMASDLDGNAKPILARARMVLLNNV